MTDFRIGYLYSFAPIHCGGEGDIGNISEIAREVHTTFPYVPGSSLRGSLRDEVTQLNSAVADKLFGEELGKDGRMGVHQVWFGDARLLWVPMRTLSQKDGGDIFTWVSCHSLIRDHALAANLPAIEFPENAVGTCEGTYIVADARLQVQKMSESQRGATALAGNWPDALGASVQPAWAKNHMVLRDADFQVLMEHSLWTQVRNRIQDDPDGANRPGSAEIFWTDVCIPRDTILYYPWGYKLLKDNPVESKEHELLMQVLQGLLQIGGQANVGRGWVQSWVNNPTDPQKKTEAQLEEELEF